MASRLIPRSRDRSGEAELLREADALQFAGRALRDLFQENDLARRS